MNIIWFRNDLRLADNPALRDAVDSGGPVLPVYIHAPEEHGDWQPGAASNWWLHHSLTSLDADLKTIGSRLVVLRGPSMKTLQSLIHETKATAVFWNRRYEPTSIANDKSIKDSLKSAGIEVQSFNGSLLFEPWNIANKSGKPFQVFTPFWKTCVEQLADDKAAPAPGKLDYPPKLDDEIAIEELSLLPEIDWDAGFQNRWKPGVGGAKEALEGFVRDRLQTYGQNRDIPADAGTSSLSPHLHFGEISPRQILATISNQSKNKDWMRNQFITELGWREFAHHLLFHFPHTTDAPMRENFADFPWNEPEQELQAWQRGRTGYPLVDAGMRELWTTGWMHNRVRMVVGSFLVKDLLIDWRHGARWFWDTLVDADLANNTLGWQWVAGCGADAAPFFRIFNPVSQGEKFDPDGAYVRRWVPELKNLPDRFIHRPWEASSSVLRDAEISLGENYPEAIIDHSTARNVALDAYAKIKRG